MTVVSAKAKAPRPLASKATANHELPTSDGEPSKKNLKNAEKPAIAPMCPASARHETGPALNSATKPAGRQVAGLDASTAIDIANASAMRTSDGPQSPMTAEIP